MKIAIIGLFLVVILALATPAILNHPNDASSTPNTFSSWPPDNEQPQATEVKVFKWQDAKGHWHYGDKPPEHKPSQTLNVRTDTNIVRSVKIPPKKTVQTPKKPATKPKKQPDMALPITLSPEKVGTLIQDARNVQSLVDKRARDIDNAQ